MEKKKILIVYTSYLDLGGIERSLLGLLDNIDYDKYEVDLFLYGHHGSLFHLINPRCNLLPEVKELSHIRESLISKLKHGCFYSAFYRIKDAITRNKDVDATWSKLNDKFAPYLETNYDIAISFFRPFNFIMNHVNSPLKVGWIHTDYSEAGENLDIIYKDYVHLDKIVAVSDACKNSFCNLFPELKDKTIVIENCLSKTYVIEQSNIFVPDDMESNNDEIILCSIGRFSNAKNFDNVPNICKRILDKGLNVKWYLIGFGGDEQLIRDKIKESHMEGNVIILGKKDNPYPYIKACDYYIQPSRYEGKAVTVREAQILCKPVIITRFPTSSSQLTDGYDGVIVDMDNEGCAQGIVDFINNKELQEAIINNLKNNDYSNADEVEKIYKLMED